MLGWKITILINIEVTDVQTKKGLYYYISFFERGICSIVVLVFWGKNEQFYYYDSIPIEKSDSEASFMDLLSANKSLSICLPYEFITSKISYH